jgi:methylthioribose-1-phosphate isomerase
VSTSAEPTVPATLKWHGDAVSGSLHLVDQTRLPLEEHQVACHDLESVFEAIQALRVRGAPAIGVAAAYGVVIGARAAESDGDAEAVVTAVRAASRRLAGSRPTARNLFWALERMESKAVSLASLANASGATVIAGLLVEAQVIERDDREICCGIGRHGEPLVPDGSNILTHCNAGALATAGQGTALGVVYAAKEAGKQVRVLAGETRPLLQGARLTAWELQRSGIDVTLLPDVAAATVLQRGMADLVIVGADRVARNGDVANKIGTYPLAIMAREHSVPFYVAAPLSTFDAAAPDGAAIPIEERDGGEVTGFGGVRTAPEGVASFNPAFDVTPARLITALITERGVIHAPDEAKVSALLRDAGQLVE